MKARTFWLAAAAACLLSWPAGAKDVNWNSADYPVIHEADSAAGGSGLYLDRKSIRVADADGENLILQVDVVSFLPDRTAVSRQIFYKLDSAGNEFLLGPDGAWRELSENSEDPAAVGAILVRNELGRDDRRNEFLGQIQQILLKKKADESAAKAKPSPDHASGEKTPAAGTGKPAATSVSSGENLPDPSREPAPSGEPAPKPAPNRKDGEPSSKPPAAPSRQTGGKPGKTEKPAPQPDRKDSPDVVVNIESHEPQVQIEIKKG